MHIQPAPEISQHHTAEALPPASNGYENVVATVENLLRAHERQLAYHVTRNASSRGPTHNPLMETAKEKDDR